MNTVIYWFITRPYNLDKAANGTPDNGNDPTKGDSIDEALWRAGGLAVSGTPCKEPL